MSRSLLLSVVIVVTYSLLLIAFDEWVAKPLRYRRWQRRAREGDQQAAELLRVAREVQIREDA